MDMKILILACALSLAASASAQTMPKPLCLPDAAEAILEPETLMDLVKCQRREESKIIRTYEEKKRKPLPDVFIAQLLEHQQAEIQEYMDRHPERYKKKEAAAAKPAPPSEKPKLSPKTKAEMGPEIRAFFEAETAPKTKKASDDEFSLDPEENP